MCREGTLKDYETVFGEFQRRTFDAFIYVETVLEK